MNLCLQPLSVLTLVGPWFANVLIWRKFFIHRAADVSDQSYDIWKFSLSRFSFLRRLQRVCWKTEKLHIKVRHQRQPDIYLPFSKNLTSPYKGLRLYSRPLFSAYQRKTDTKQSAFTYYYQHTVWMWPLTGIGDLKKKRSAHLLLRRTKVASWKTECTDFLFASQQHHFFISTYINWSFSRLKSENIRISMINWSVKDAFALYVNKIYSPRFRHRALL